MAMRPRNESLEATLDNKTQEFADRKIIVIAGETHLTEDRKLERFLDAHQYVVLRPVHQLDDIEMIEKEELKYYLQIDE